MLLVLIVQEEMCLGNRGEAQEPSLVEWMLKELSGYEHDEVTVCEV